MTTLESTLVEVIQMNDSVIAENWLNDLELFRTYLKDSLSDDQWNRLTWLTSKRSEAYDVLNRTCPDACDPCSKVCRMREVTWVQDKIMTGRINGRRFSLFSCRGDLSLESALISSKLQKNGLVDTIIGFEVCFDGANVFRSNRTIVARDVLKFSTKVCPDNGRSLLKLQDRFERLFDNQRIDWLSLSLYPNPLDVGGRDSISIPLHHMDLFMNFGLSENDEWTAFVGEVKMKYYSGNYLNTGLTLEDSSALSQLNLRLDSVVGILQSWGYKTIRIPLVPLHYPRSHKINGILTFNNALVECFERNGAWVKNIYLTDYDYKDVRYNNYRAGLNTAQLRTDVQNTYESCGYNVKWVEGLYNSKSYAGIRCYTQTLVRSP